MKEFYKWQDYFLNRPKTEIESYSYNYTDDRSKEAFIQLIGVKRHFTLNWDKEAFI